MVGRRGWVMMAGAAALSVAGLGCSNNGAGSAGPATTGTGSGGPATAAAPAEWRVGAYLSLSGADAQFGIDTKEGIELAVDEINKHGGAKGRPLKVFYEDDKSNPQEATNKVIELIDRDKVS